MERRGEEENQKIENEIRKGNENPKVKSCKGFLYYSSTLKSQNRNPRCIGIPRTLPHVKSHGFGLIDTDSKASKQVSDLVKFEYVCAGYSQFMSKNEVSIDNEGTKPALPVCTGLKLLRYIMRVPADTASAPTHVHSREDRDIRQTQPHKPTHAVEDFLNRFTRNANLVASRVARDMRRVGNNIKKNVEDILSPYRRPPK